MSSLGLPSVNLLFRSETIGGGGGSGGGDSGGAGDGRDGGGDGRGGGGDGGGGGWKVGGRGGGLCCVGWRSTLMASGPDDATCELK